MEELITEVVKDSGNSSTLIWALLVWVLAREFLPSVVKKFRNGKTPYLEIMKEKIDFIYLREKQRETIQKNELEERIKTLTNKKES